MKWASIPYSYLAMTKPSEYSEESRLEVAGHSKYSSCTRSSRHGIGTCSRRRALQDHAGAHQDRPRYRRSTSTPPTRLGSTIRSSSWRSRPTSPATSSTSSSACAPRSRRCTRSVTPDLQLHRDVGPRTLAALDGEAVAPRRSLHWYDEVDTATPGSVSHHRLRSRGSYARGSC